MRVGIRLFTASKARAREALGDRITDWIRDNPDIRLFDRVVLQSSDAEFHCLTIVLFFHIAT